MRILIAEDEFISALALRRQLEQEGFTVIGVYSRGRDAIDAADQQKPDVLLLDVQLEDEIDGVAVAASLRSRSQVIFTTAYADQAMQDRADATNPIAILSKPVNFSALLELLRRID